MNRLLLALALVCGACSEQEETRLRQELAETKRALSRLEQDKELDHRKLSSQLDDSRARLASLPGTLDLHLPFELNGEEIELEQAYWLGGAQVTFFSLRYWLSGLSLFKEDGERVDIPNSYYLMELTRKREDGRGDETQYTQRKRDTIRLREVPAGRYVALGFNIGVDPEHNDDLSLGGGELNVLSNMARAEWMWFTSYIFTSLWVHYLPPGTPEDRVVSVGFDSGGNEDLRRVGVAIHPAIEVGLDHQPVVRAGMNSQHLFDGLVDHILSGAADTPDFPNAYIGSADDELRSVLSTNWQIAFENKAR